MPIIRKDTQYAFFTKLLNSPPPQISDNYYICPKMSQAESLRPRSV